MELLEGKQISLKIKENILNELAKIQEKPVLYVLVNENDLSSIGYVKMIEKNCLRRGWRNLYQKNWGTKQGKKMHSDYGYSSII